MNKMEINLFDELVLSELDLSKIISKYHFPRSHYAHQLASLGFSIPEDDDAFRNLVLSNCNKINFRTKNIIFIGYSKDETNKYYFLQLTTKKSKQFRQTVYFVHENGHTVYINPNKIHYFNFDAQKVWKSKFNDRKEKIKQCSHWKADILNNFNAKNLKSLARRTNIKIYENKLKEYNFFKNLVSDAEFWPLCV